MLFEAYFNPQSLQMWEEIQEQNSITFYTMTDQFFNGILCTLLFPKVTMPCFLLRLSFAILRQLESWAS